MEAKDNKELVLYKTKIKSEISSKTKNIEASVVSMFWKHPEFYIDYSNLKSDVFNSSVWKMMFIIGQKMALKGYNKFTEAETILYLQSNKKLLQAYEDIGGFKLVEDLWEVVDKSNIDSHIEDLQKYGVLKTVVEDFSIDVEFVEQASKLSSDKLYDFYYTKLNNLTAKKDEDYISNTISDGLEELINEADKGVNKGLPIKSPVLSSETNGLSLGCLNLLVGGSGTGKTTFLLDCIMPSLFENEESAIFIINEQSTKKIRQQFLTYIINNMIATNKEDKFSSKRWNTGGFTPKEREQLLKAKTILEEKESSKKIIIVELKSYNRRVTERIIKKYAIGMGAKYFFIDTLKLSGDLGKGDQTWLSLMMDVLSYSELIKDSNLNVHLTCTCQLQKVSRSIRYLDNSLIGQSKSIIDTASVVILFRRMLPDEYDGGKHAICVKKKIEGTSALIETHLDQSEQHMIAFITKNRFGSSEEYQIIAKQDLGYLIYEEEGICFICPD